MTNWRRWVHIVCCLCLAVYGGLWIVRGQIFTPYPPVNVVGAKLSGTGIVVPADKGGRVVSIRTTGKVQVSPSILSLSVSVPARMEKGTLMVGVLEGEGWQVDVKVWRKK